MVVACFVIALAILVLTVVNMRRERRSEGMTRRADDKPVHIQLDHRKVE